MHCTVRQNPTMWIMPLSMGSSCIRLTHGAIHTGWTTDPFFSEANMAYVKKSVHELRAGKGTAHELIEVDDE